MRNKGEKTLYFLMH